MFKWRAAIAGMDANCVYCTTLLSKKLPGDGFDLRNPLQ
jgi:hypothetical protein